MATYLYETIPQSSEDPVRRFEVRQSMMDAPLTKDPETGLPVRRVITGGYGFMGLSSKKASRINEFADCDSGNGGGGCCCNGNCPHRR